MSQVNGSSFQIVLFVTKATNTFIIREMERRSKVDTTSRQTLSQAVTYSSGPFILPRSFTLHELLPSLPSPLTEASKFPCVVELANLFFSLRSSFFITPPPPPPPTPFPVLGFELRAYTLRHSTSPFLMGFFKIGSHQLFAGAGI
jgi:hypothetical protein